MSNFLSRLKNPLRGSSTGPEAEEIKALSDQFRVTLLAAASKIEAAGHSPGNLDRIKNLLQKEDWRWKDAYEVEQQVVLLYDDATLRTELSRRTLEAERVLYADVADWYREQFKEAMASNEQRALLLRLVNDLQWRYTVNEAKLGYVKQITGRTGWIFIFAVVIFIGFLFVQFNEITWLKDFRESQFFTFLLAAVSGLLGASFSMVASLKTRLESSSINQMKNASSRAILLSRVLVGTGASMILYFFFVSGLMKGAAFPDFDSVLENSTLDAKAIMQRAMLIVWCFIAGFSEKLVPGLLAKTEAQVADQVQSPPHGPTSPIVSPPSEAFTTAPTEPGTTDTMPRETGESEAPEADSRGRAP